MKSAKEDIYFIRQCIELSKTALRKGDKPFGAIVALNGKIISKATNKSKKKVYEHAELLALDKASRVLKTTNLSGCTLYSNCEPCASCSFFIREYHIERVIYSISSSRMGGFSHFLVLQDKELSKLKPYFGEIPRVTKGVLEEEAWKVFEGAGLADYFDSPKSQTE